MGAVPYLSVKIEMKPEFVIDISEGSESPLEALQTLSILDPNEGRHISQNLRPALGIYNTSISRICDKVTKCCEKLEAYFNTSTKKDVLMRENSLRKEIIDYLELSLYAAAEHVDDLQLISKYFFANNEQYKASPHAIVFSSTIKKQKNLITASINAIKHHQARIRLYSTEIIHANVYQCLHGYFIEGVNNGAIGPNKIFHGGSKKIFSITSLIWEILCFILISSRNLNIFLNNTFGVPNPKGSSVSDGFTKAVIAAARLPLYSFDDDHPFSTSRLIIHANDSNSVAALDSKIYGSIKTKWFKSNDMVFLGGICNFEGDGVTKSFDMAHPSTLKIQHWD